MAQNSPRQSGAAASPIRQAKAEALFEHIRIGDLLAISGHSYRWLRDTGLSRADVDRAVDDLAAAGRIQLDQHAGVIQLHLADPTAPDPDASRRGPDMTPIQ